MLAKIEGPAMPTFMCHIKHQFPSSSGRIRKGEVRFPEGIRKGKHRVGTSVAGGGPRVWNVGICLGGIEEMVFGGCLLEGPCVWNCGICLGGIEKMMFGRCLLGVGRVPGTVEFCLGGIEEIAV